MVSHKDDTTVVTLLEKALIKECKPKIASFTLGIEKGNLNITYFFVLSKKFFMDKAICGKLLGD